MLVYRQMFASGTRFQMPFYFWRGCRTCLQLLMSSFIMSVFCLLFNLTGIVKWRSRSISAFKASETPFFLRQLRERNKQYIGSCPGRVLPF